MKALNPDNIHPPFARYSHGISAQANTLVATSGQLGIQADGTVPEGASGQADVCFQNIDAILAEAREACLELRVLGSYPRAQRIV